MIFKEIFFCFRKISQKKIFFSFSQKEKIPDQSTTATTTTKSPKPSSIKRLKLSIIDQSDLLATEETSTIMTTAVNEDEIGISGGGGGGGVSSGDDCCSNKSTNQLQDPNSMINTQNCM